MKRRDPVETSGTRLEYQPLSELVPADRNPRTHNLEAIKQSFARFGYTNPVIINEKTGKLVAGHGRLQALAQAKGEGMPIPRAVLERDGEWLVPVVRGIAFDSDAEAEAYLVADNRLTELATWQEAELARMLQELQADTGSLAGTGYSDDDLLALLKELEGDTGDGTGDDIERKPLAEKFGAPPFSVLDTRRGYWQERKYQWLGLGIRSDLGRDPNLTDAPDLPKWAKSSKHNDSPSHGKTGPATSVFDPVVAELMYRWYAPAGGKVLDPFAGGSVRGLLAVALGRTYTGLELRAEQVEANEQQWLDVGPRLPHPDPARPEWRVGDSDVLLDEVEDEAYDMVLTCPPYGSLERYSDDPRDISNMEVEQFNAVYTSILQKTWAKLKHDRFFAVVVSEYRDRNKDYPGLVPLTITALQEVGARYHSESILVSGGGGAIALRAGRIFLATRRVSRAHQNVLVFLKGDAKRASDLCGTADDALAELSEADRGDGGEHDLDSAFDGGGEE